jgi:hypothetical protein
VNLEIVSNGVVFAAVPGDGKRTRLTVSAQLKVRPELLGGRTHRGAKE